MGCFGGSVRLPRMQQNFVEPEEVCSGDVDERVENAYRVEDVVMARWCTGGELIVRASGGHKDGCGVGCLIGQALEVAWVPVPRKEPVEPDSNAAMITAMARPTAQAAASSRCGIVIAL